MSEKADRVSGVDVTASATTIKEAVAKGVEGRPTNDERWTMDLYPPARGESAVTPETADLVGDTRKR